MRESLATARRQATPPALQATPSTSRESAGSAATSAALGSAQPSMPPLQRRQTERLAYTRAELAKLAGLCEKTIANHEYPRGNLRFIRIGPRGKRYLSNDVQAWLESLRGE